MNKQYRGVLWISGIVLSVSLCIFLFSLFIESKKGIKPELSTVNYVEKIQGLPEKTKIHIDYLSKERNFSTMLLADKNTLSLSPNNQIQKIISQNSYAVNYGLHISENNYRDIALHINKNKKYLNTNLSGFKTGDKASLTINGQTYYSATPVDWAGRITFDIKSVNIPPATICLKIKDNKGKISSLCHFSPAAERQVS